MRYARENEWNDAVATASARYGVPAPLLKAIIAVESEWNPNARRGEAGGVVSYGLGQVTPAAAGISADDGPRLFDPAYNIDRAAAFLAENYHMLGSDEARAASAYNGGNRPSLGFGTKLTVTKTVCLQWKTNAPATGRTIAEHCQVPFTGKAGQFGNQPYVDKVMALRTYYSGELQVSANTMGTVAAAALGVAALVVIARR